MIIHVETQYHEEAVCKEYEKIVLTAPFASHVVKVYASDSVLRSLDDPQADNIKEHGKKKDNESYSYYPKLINSSIHGKINNFEKPSLV